MQGALGEEPAFDVFICHAGIHDEWADSFYENLRAAGFSVSNDRYHQSPGEHFPSKIERTIRTAKAALVLLGGEARKSPWVVREMDALLARKDRDSAFLLLPALVEAEDPAWPLPMGYGGRDRIDFRPPADYRTAIAG